MSDRIPDPGSAFEDEGIPDPGDALPGQVVSGAPPEESAVPGDRPLGLDFPTTDAEEAEGERLDGRLAREEPDVLTDEAIARDPGDGTDSDDLSRPFEPETGVGRLVADDEGARADTTSEEVAHDVGADSGGMTAEESAMHVAPESADTEPDLDPATGLPG